MKKRVISAVIALLIVIPLIILGGIWFQVGASLIGLIGFNELLTVREKKKKLPVAVKLLGVVSFILIMLSSLSSTFEFIIDYRYLVIPLILLMSPIVFYNKSKRYDIEDSLFMIGSVFFLGIAFNFLINIRSIDIYYFLYMVIITIMSDTFAHFFGTKIGKYKLCPSVSPNKTIEGFVGGTLLGTFSGVMFITTVYTDLNIMIVILISLLLSIMSALGDLVFSSIKRHFDVKDFGNIMPGHGGILDRVDSILFATIAFALVISLL